jgi:hypothetical protein
MGMRQNCLKILLISHYQSKNRMLINGYAAPNTRLLDSIRSAITAVRYGRDLSGGSAVMAA